MGLPIKRFVLAVAIPIVVLASTVSASADFVFSDFLSASDLTLVGSAATSGGRLRLTPAVAELSGGAWFGTKQPVQGGFQTSFRFELQGGNSSDGFALVIQNAAANALIGPGGRLGYGGFGNEAGGIPNSVAIEFDTFQNSENSDPSNNHVSVQSRGTLPNSSNQLYSLGATTPGTALAASGVHEVLVTYVPGSLAVYLDGALAPLLVAPVDLGDLLALDGDNAWVGFTAGTGSGFQSHDIISWQFAAIPEPSAWVLALLGPAVVLARRVRVAWTR